MYKISSLFLGTFLLFNSSLVFGEAKKEPPKKETKEEKKDCSCPKGYIWSNSLGGCVEKR